MEEIPLNTKTISQATALEPVVANHATTTNSEPDVLVVDDNANNLKLVHTLLKDKGYKVRLATNGEMAIKSARANPPDLILLDINMPGLDGYDTCEALKNDKLTKDIPIIFLSAIKESFDIVRGFDVGGIDFVTKPFKPEVLLARVETHLSLHHLQSELVELNTNLERKVEERTCELIQANISLQDEVEKRIQTQNELLASEELHRLTLANLENTIVITTDKQGSFTYISPNIESILGYTPEEVLELEDIGKLLGNDIFTLGERNRRFEKEIRSKDGAQRYLFISTKKALIRKDVTIYTCQDITNRKYIEKELASSEERLKHALSASNEGLWDWDLSNDKTYHNEACYSLLGYQPSDFETGNIHNHWHEIVHADDKSELLKTIKQCREGRIEYINTEYRYLHKNGKYIWFHTKGVVVEKDKKGKSIRLVGTHTDITKQKNYEEHLRQLATYDDLTDLPNRKLFLELLNGAIARGRRKTLRHAVLFLDLDRFKNINDSLGHSAGDKLLQQVAQRIDGILREDDTVARLGGDEFTILLQDISESHRAAEAASRVIEILNEPFDLKGHRVSVAPSIGIVLYPDHATTSEELLKKADTAMYHAKHDGGQNYKFFSSVMDEEARTRLELEAEMRQSLTRDEFVLFYQPKINLNNGNITGMEALVRWNNRNKGMIPPGAFIPIAEETGLIVQLGDIILQRAAMHTRDWADRQLFQNKVAVNISARQFRQEDLLLRIDGILEETGLSPEALELEVTEAAAMQDTDSAIQTMKNIKARGITLALDDFGTGYSSLSYLKKFPIDTLKIDMSFIRDMEQSESNRNIVHSIIELAHNLNLEVIAEGVETIEQAHTLTEMHCDGMQGYLFSKPVNDADFEQLLKEKKNLY